MTGASLLLAAALAAGPAAGCLDDAAAPERARLLAAVNRHRTELGHAALRFHPILCRVAQERARELAAAGSPDSRPGSVEGVSRRLFSLGYRAHRWEEHALMGEGDLLAFWRGERGRQYRQVVLGDFQEMGIGIARSRNGATLLSLLFVLPKREYFVRQTTPLGDLEAVRKAVLARVNEERRKRGRRPLVPDPRLDRAAQDHADAMLERTFYDHRDPEGDRAWERVVETGYRPRRVGENIAKGIFSPREVVERWLGSEGHRRNTLSAGFREMGVGLAFGENAEGFEVLWVQVFATPR